MPIYRYAFTYHGKSLHVDLDPKKPESLKVLDEGLCWQCDAQLSASLEAGTVSGNGDQILCCGKCDTQYRLALVK